MEQIKKKLANLKAEKDAAEEKADEAESRRKEAEARAEAVRAYVYVFEVQCHPFNSGCDGKGKGFAAGSDLHIKGSAPHTIIVS